MQKARRSCMAKTYENLEAWIKGVDLAVIIYEITRNFPKEEIYGLTSQIRRSVISISSNLAEGAGRPSKKDFRRFVDIAMGSLNETESLLIVASKLGFVDEQAYLSTRNKTAPAHRQFAKGGLIFAVRRAKKAPWLYFSRTD